VRNPLLVSVRSGSRASMPGMMDTVLNLGLNDQTAEGLAKLSGDRRFAYDSYRRFIQMYSNVVLNISHDEFEHILDDYKESRDFNLDTDLGAESWIEVIALYKKAVEKRIGRPFPQEPKDQLWGAIGAVFASWMNDRAITYRRSTTFRKAGARPSTCSRWCSATWAKAPPPASPSRAIPPPAKSASTANTWSTRRAKTSSPASARPRRSPTRARPS
jgi:phosphoenolpyruvate synthase/pyruvate phosphate dikinase